MEVIYLDSWFALNLLCDYLLCLLTGRIAGLCLKRRRYLLAALLGSLYACAVYVPGLGFLAAPGWRLLCGGAMAAIAYGCEARPLRCAGLFFAVAAAFGGSLSLLSAPGGGPLRLSFGSLATAFALCYGLGSLLFRWQNRFQSRGLHRVELGVGGRSVCFSALHDTGNSLSDPLSGARVMAVSPRALAPLFGEEAALLRERDPVLLLEKSGRSPVWKGRLRLLPFSALGGGGLLPVFRPDALRLDGEERRDLLVAIAPEAAGEGFEGIV